MELCHFGLIISLILRFQLVLLYYTNNTSYLLVYNFLDILDPGQPFQARGLQSISSNQPTSLLTKLQFTLYVPQQEHFLEDCLTVAPRDRLTVPQFRPAWADSEVIEHTYNRVNLILRKIIGSRQVIQLHNVTGGADVA